MAAADQRVESPAALPPPPPALSWSRFVLLRANLVRAAKLAWQLDARLLTAFFLAQLADALLPVAIAYAGKPLVDAVVHASLDPAHPTQLALRWVALELVLVVAKLAAGQWHGYLAQVLRAKMSGFVDTLIFEKALSLSLKYFEDPEFMNALERARKESGWRPVEVITHGFTLARNAVTLAGFSALLWGFSPWAIPALLLAALPFIAEVRYGAEQYAIKTARTQDERQAGYLQTLLCSDWHVKEIKLFGLGPHLVERYAGYQSRFVAQDRDFASRRGRAVTVLGALSLVSFYAVYAWIVRDAVFARITLGAMTMYLGVFRQGSGAFQAMMNTLARAYEDNLYLSNLFSYLAIPADDAASQVFPPRSENAAPPRLHFEKVSFAYPGSARAALDEVSFTVEPGETVALVGANGAGKTTLVKMLTGLYTPTGGRVLLGDEDVRSMEKGALRARIGAVFQDFVHYHFTAHDNVALGWVPSMNDREAVTNAARDAGADEVIDTLPKGYDTLLGRWFGGEQLSVGQWQRVAVARAFMRRAEVLVLDEPTSAIDAEAEHQVFERFRELKRGRTALLITHRFGTVRMADRIVVLEHGRVAEQGTHAELLERDGLYARMFKLQAEGYRAEP